MGDNYYRLVRRPDNHNLKDIIIHQVTCGVEMSSWIITQRIRIYDLSNDSPHSTPLSLAVLSSLFDNIEFEKIKHYIIKSKNKKLKVVRLTKKRKNNLFLIIYSLF